MTLQAQWRALGVSNIADHVCRVARATASGEWRQAQLEHVYAVRAAAYLNLDALEGRRE